MQKTRQTQPGTEPGAATTKNVFFNTTISKEIVTHNYFYVIKTRSILLLLFTQMHAPPKKQCHRDTRFFPTDESRNMQLLSRSKS